jgi:hypothetical protein
MVIFVVTGIYVTLSPDSGYLWPGRISGNRKNDLRDGVDEPKNNPDGTEHDQSSRMECPLAAPR